jgi:tetratricopeptide (TPR) repeat protein
LFICKRISKIRKSLNLTQGHVAEGVVSPSHYSNLESGRYDPAEDILVLIAKKLNVPPEYLTMFDQVNEQLETVLLDFKKYIFTNLEQAHKVFELIRKNYPYIASIYQETLFYLLSGCYYARANNIEKTITIFQNELIPLIDDSKVETFSKDFRELYYYLKGRIHYQQKEYIQSYESYLQQLPLIEDPIMKANNFYNLSMSCLKLNDFNRAVSFGKEALNIYLYENKWIDTADLYNLLGVIYWEKGELNEAGIHLMKALELAKQFDLQNNIERIYHNLGLVYKENGDIDKALSHLSMSLSHKKKAGSKTILLTYRSILLLFIGQGLYSEAKKLLIEAKTYCKVPDDHIFLRVISGKISYGENKKEEYEYCIKEAIDFFKDTSGWKHVRTLSEELALHYERERKYKLATIYLKQVLEANNYVLKGD